MVAHLQLLQGEAAAQTLLAVVLDGLATHNRLQGASGRAWESLLGLLSAGCGQRKETCLMHDFLCPLLPSLLCCRPISKVAVNQYKAAYLPSCAPCEQAG